MKTLQKREENSYTNLVNSSRLGTYLELGLTLVKFMLKMRMAQSTE